jgi:hypothetical protein
MTIVLDIVGDLDVGTPTGDNPGPSGGGTDRFILPVDYHLSEAGALRLMAVLHAMATLLSIPVRLEEYSDC